MAPSMPEDPKIVRLRPQDAEAHPDLTPELDPTVDVLLELALAGELRVYFAAVPTALIRLFDTDVRPSRQSGRARGRR